MQDMYAKVSFFKLVALLGHRGKNKLLENPSD